MASTDWFTEARFGMFIHWGLYSLPAGIWQGRRIRHEYAEWLQASERVPRAAYRALAKDFNPAGFDADAWIREAANAGMRYVVVTAKHHDGFALWPSRASTFNVADATPFRRDIIGELADACRRHGIRLGLYYSHWQDWEGTGGDICSVNMENEEYVHPTEAEFARYWRDKCLAQVRELITAYDPALLWFDTWSEASLGYITPARQEELIALVRSLSGSCLVNSRIQFLAPSDQVDFISTMDNTFPEQGFAKPWETSGTLNDSWGHHALDHRWRSARELIRNLVRNAALGGNYQLNVGPMADGRFPVPVIRRLREIGAWLHVHTEAIHGTSGGIPAKAPWGHVTQRRLGPGRTRLYLHLWSFTPGTAILLDGVTGHPVAAEVLESGEPILAEAGTGGLWLRLPERLDPDGLPVIRLDLAPTP